MHEFGITSRIVDAVSRLAQENGGAKVLRVDLLIGQLTFLSPRQVKLAYEILVKGTPLEGSELLIQDSEGIIECSICGHQRHVTVSMVDDLGNPTEALPLFSCSECGGKISIIKGKECQIVGIALEA